MSRVPNILEAITRDPDYVRKLQSDDTGTFGRSWDDRFVLARIPTYDAVNDRFCKFLKRRPQKTAPLRKGPGSLVKIEDMAHDEPKLSLQSKPLNKIAPKENSENAVQNLEVIFAKAKSRLFRLWDEVNSKETERIQFSHAVLNDVTPENLAIINDEIQLLQDLRVCRENVDKKIEIREGFLYLLQELAERYSSAVVDKERALRELHAIVSPLRSSSVETVEAIAQWKERSKSRIFLWKGVSYLKKMNFDVMFLAHSKLGKLLDFVIVDNPLLDPRKLVEELRVGKVLPPLRRAQDAAKDIAKDRLDRCERILFEEIRVSPSREVETLESNFVRDEEEKLQLVSTEDSWLAAQRPNEESQPKEFIAAIKIQTAYRAYVARRFVKALGLQQKTAIRIQSCVRVFLAKLKARRLRRMLRSAQKIQSLQRGRAVRERMAIERTKSHAAIQIQRIVRGHFARKTVEMMKFIHRCATDIQRVFRGHRDRLRVKRGIVAERAAAAITIQRVFRGFLVRKNPYYATKKTSSAIRIQSWARGNADRKIARMLRRNVAASVRIQAWWRMMRAQRLAAKLLEERSQTRWEASLIRAVKAATKLQAFWRSVLARNFVASIRSERQQAIMDFNEQLQRIAEQNAAEERHRQEAAAIKISATFRGFAARKHFVMAKHIRNAAVEIQRGARGMLARNRARKLRDSTTHSELLQCLESTKLSVLPLATPDTRSVQTLEHEAEESAEHGVLDLSEVNPDPEPTFGKDESVAHDETSTDVGDHPKANEPLVVSSIIPQDETTSEISDHPKVNEPLVVSSVAIQDGTMIEVDEDPKVNEPPVIEIRREHAARVLQRFFRLVVAKKATKALRLRRMHHVGKLRSQSQIQAGAFASTMIVTLCRKWKSRRGLIRLLRDQAKNREFARNTAARAQEIDWAACAISRFFRQVALIRRARAARELRGHRLILEAKTQERHVAVVRLQSFRRKRATLRRREGRAQRAVATAISQERRHAIVMIQCHWRKCLAKRRTAILRSLREVPIRELLVQEAFAAATVVQCFARYHFSLLSVLSNRAGADPVVDAQNLDKVEPQTTILADDRHEVVVSHSVAEAVHPQDEPLVLAVHPTPSAGDSHAQIGENAATASDPISTEPKQASESSSEALPQSTTPPDPPLETRSEVAPVENTSPQVVNDIQHAEPPEQSLVTATPAVEQKEAQADGESKPSVPVDSPRDTTGEAAVVPHSPQPDDEVVATPKSPDTEAASQARPDEVVAESVATVTEPEIAASQPVVESQSRAPLPSSQPDVESSTEQLPTQGPSNESRRDERIFRAVLLMQNWLRAVVCSHETDLRRDKGVVDAHLQILAEGPIELTNVDDRVDLNERDQISHLALEFERRNKAAMVIQRGYRCYNARFYRRWKTEERRQKRQEQAHADFLKGVDLAALTIQCAYRRHRAQLFVAEKRQRKNEMLEAIRLDEARRNRAALAIQCAFRCYSARFHTAWLRRRRAEEMEVRRVALAAAASETHQQLLLEQAAQQRQLLENKAAVTIQCAVRQYNARFERNWRLQARNESEKNIRLTATDSEISSARRQLASEETALMIAGAVEIRSAL